MVGRSTDDDRGQAYTLEAIVSSFIVLTALLFVVQSIVLTPTTAGTVDQDVKGQLQMQAHDTLVLASGDGMLRNLALNWNNTTGGFAYAYNPESGYGKRAPCSMGPETEQGACASFGEMLNETFTAQGFVYNLYLDYRNESDVRETETVRVTYNGVPTSDAVTATYTVLLYDDMRLTAPEDATGRPLGDLDDDEFYARDVESGPIYTVVEVRLTVW